MSKPLTKKEIIAKLLAHDGTSPPCDKWKLAHWAKNYAAKFDTEAFKFIECRNIDNSPTGNTPMKDCIRNTIAYRDVSVTELQEIMKYVHCGFKSAQFHMICVGLTKSDECDSTNLTPEQVAIYAKTCYNDSQMEEIRMALIAKIPTERLELILNPSIPYLYMREIITMCKKFKNLDNLRAKITLMKLEGKI